jgi:hypothetical protein
VLWLERVPLVERADSARLPAPVSLARLHAESGFTVEIERASNNDEVTVRVRGPSERSLERAAR